MEWYGDGVLNAITTCRQEQALFLVFVIDDSSDSQATSEAWNCEEVVEVLKKNKYVALKIRKESVEFNQFSQFFAVFVFPSIYCIDLSGKPIVVLNGQLSANTLRIKLMEAFAKLKDQMASLNSENAASVASSSERNSDENKAAASSPSTTTSALPLKEQKREKYEQKIKQRRQEKVEADRQREKDQEKDRREHGRNIAKFKEMQAEQHNKNWMSERQKQKDEARLAREEVRAKLEQDRRERENKQRTAASLHHRHHEASGSKSETREHWSSKHSGMSRIQLRLPAGSTKIVEVDSSASLHDLKQKVSEVLDVSSSKFSLIRLYPRKDLDSSVDSHSMSELNLVPTGVVIVRMNQSLTTSGGTSFWAAMTTVVNFILWIFTIIKNFGVKLFSSSPPATGQSEPSSDVRRYRNFESERRVQKFRQEDDDDDDSGTYNGNSTQQQ